MQLIFFQFSTEAWLKGHWNSEPLATITLFYYCYYYLIFVISSPLFPLKILLHLRFFSVEDALSFKRQDSSKSLPDGLLNQMRSLCFFSVVLS